MSARTNGRRNRPGDLASTFFTDSLEDEDDAVLDLAATTSSSSQDFYGSFAFSSQESSAPWPNPSSFAFGENGGGGDAIVRRTEPKKPRRNVTGHSRPLIPSTSTLMEAQESGEKMEHEDEVNFALDGLRKGQPARIRRASLLSLMENCATPQQRRLLRAQGMAKTIIDAILGLSFDDSPSNLAAATLFYVLTSDGQDDYLLESPSCIRLLIKLLKPVVPTASENKARNIGSKLLALRKDNDILRDTNKLADFSAAAIVAKVQEILINCQDIKSCSGGNSAMERPELSPKWIALLTMEKACVSKISFEDAYGAVRKTGGNFKEKLRELGGLDAIFEITVNCHAVMESWAEHGSTSTLDAKDDQRLRSLVLLLKCLKIMENATFLSKDNQSHLLGMKRLDSRGCRVSFTKVMISIIKILSGLCLSKSSTTSSGGKENPCSPTNRDDNASDFTLISNYKGPSNEVISISSTNCCSSDRMSFGQSFCGSQKSTSTSIPSISSSANATALMSDTCQLKLRLQSSISSTSSETFRSSNGGAPASFDGLRTRFSLVERPSCVRDVMCELLDDSEDPYAFDEDEFQPSKWDLLSGNQKKSPTKNGMGSSRRCDNRCQFHPVNQKELISRETCQQKSSDIEHHHSQKTSCFDAADEEHCSLLGDCLLMAVKVLMNLTNDNTLGCQQIAACGGLESMSSLIVDHFPLFSSSLSCFSEAKENTWTTESQNDFNLTDQELDFLVAILGLLVNLVEKDGHNRSRLAAASVSLPNSERLEEQSHRDVIPLLCSIFLANQGAGDASGEGNNMPWDDETALLQGEKEAEKMIVEAYAALLLAFLSTESKSIRDSIADCLPNHNLAILVPVLERFVAFHLSLNMISPETHKAVSEVIESCKMP